MMPKLFLIFVTLLFFIACKKAETEPPVVTIFLPEVSDSFYVADSVSINFSVSDRNLRSYKIIISNYFTHKIFYKEETTVSSSDITINKKIFIASDADTTALMNVLGIDKNGNTGSAGAVFKIKK